MWLFCSKPLQAIGTYTKPKPKEIQMLLRGEVFVNVATSEYIISELRGRITQLPYNQYVNREAGMYNFEALTKEMYLF